MEATAPSPELNAVPQLPDSAAWSAHTDNARIVGSRRRGGDTGRRAASLNERLIRVAWIDSSTIRALKPDIETAGLHLHRDSCHDIQFECPTESTRIVQH